jgi:hypothetical protein
MSAKTTMTLAEAVARYAPAEDVTDLDTARRLITALREKIARMADEAKPVDGEWTAFLDEEHDRMLHVLYDAKRLIGRPDDPYWADPPELVEAFTNFVQDWLDVAWDTARDDQEAEREPRPRRSLTPSA